MRYSRKYQPRKRPKKIRLKIIFIWILFLFLILGYVLFFSPVFEIKEIKVSGNRVIESEEIKDILKQKNFFLATKSKLRATLHNSFPRIASIDVDKNIFKKTIELKISERKEAGIFCRDDCYYIDEQGIVFEKAPQTSGTLILVIKDSSDKEIRMGDNATTKEFMTDMIELRSHFINQLGLKVLDFVTDISEDLKVDTNEGWYVLFDRSRDFDSQIKALQLVLEEKIKEGRRNLEYIDLRIENRVYYK